MGQDPSKGMPAAEAAAAYVESVEGRRTGETLDARDFGTPRAEPPDRKIDSAKLKVPHG